MARGVVHCGYLCDDMSITSKTQTGREETKARKVQNAILFNLTMKQFHKMNAYYERNDIVNCYDIYSYNTYMGSIFDSGLHCVRDYIGVTTQKQMSRFFKEFCSLKTANAYKMAREFYRKTQKQYNYEIDQFFVFDNEHCTVMKNDKIIAVKYFIED